jgi:hypothetical protein
MVLTKHVIDGVAMSTWSRVVYNNSLSLVPALACFVGGRECAQQPTVLDVFYVRSATRKRPAYYVAPPITRRASVL